MHSPHSKSFLCLFPPKQSIPFIHSSFSLIKIKSLIIADNQCPVLTIGDSSKPLIVLLARQHPQDVVTSYVIEGAIRFLLSPEGQQLRETYYFKILPMMCPDGVIHGNSICDTNG